MLGVASTQFRLSAAFVPFPIASTTALIQHPLVDSSIIHIARDGVSAPRGSGSVQRLRDLTAGLSVAGLMIPEGMAYAAIAGLLPGRALMAAIAGGLVYSALGRSRFAIVSSTSSSAALLAALLATLPGDAIQRGEMASTIILIVGILFIGLGSFGLGSLSSFISRPVLHGFAFGLAITIIVGQLPKVAGVPAVGSTVWSKAAGLLAAAPQVSWLSVALGGIALSILLVMRRFPAIPGALMLIAGGIALASLGDLPAHGVALAGPVTLQLPSLAIPDFSPALWARLVQMAVPIALILFAESWGTMRELALKHGDRLAPDRELLALGAANMGAGLVQGMPVGAGFSAGSANEAAGAGSRLSGLVAALSVATLAAFASGWVARIPEPLLAAVVIAALSHALSPRPILRLFSLGRDPWIAVAAAAGVLLFGVLNGMLLAIALSIASLLRSLARPTISELGQVGDSHDFVDRARHPEAHPTVGIAIYRPNAPMFFANAETVFASILARLSHDGPKVVVLSLEESDDLDSTAIEALGEFDGALMARGQRLILARAHDRVRAVLQRAGHTTLAKFATFSVADAVAHIPQGDP